MIEFLKSLKTEWQTNSAIKNSESKNAEPLYLENSISSNNDDCELVKQIRLHFEFKFQKLDSRIKISRLNLRK